MTTLTDDALNELYLAVTRERDARRTLATAASAITEQSAAYLRARDRSSDGTPAWVQPLGAVGAYPKGWKVQHGGVEYESLVDGNVWAPGDPANPVDSTLWRKTSTTPAPPPATSAPAWASGVTYKVGDQVTFAGKVYRCAQAHTALDGWDPATVPALWVETGTTPAPSKGSR